MKEKFSGEFSLTECKNMVAKDHGFQSWQHACAGPKIMTITEAERVRQDRARWKVRAEAAEARVKVLERQVAIGRETLSGYAEPGEPDCHWSKAGLWRKARAALAKMDEIQP